MRFNSGDQRQAEGNLAVYLKEWQSGSPSFFPADLTSRAFAEYLLDRLFRTFRCVSSRFRSVESQSDPWYRGSCAAMMRYLEQKDLFADNEVCTQVSHAIFLLATQVYCPTMFTDDLTGFRNGITGPCTLFLVTGPHKDDRVRHRPHNHPEPYVCFRPFDEKLGIVEIDERWFLVEEVPYPHLHADPATWNQGVQLIGDFLLEEASGVYHWSCRYRFLDARQDVPAYGLGATPSSYSSLHDALFTFIERAYQQWLRERSAE